LVPTFINPITIEEHDDDTHKKKPNGHTGEQRPDNKVLYNSYDKTSTWWSQ